MLPVNQNRPMIRRIAARIAVAGAALIALTALGPSGSAHAANPPHITAWANYGGYAAINVTGTGFGPVDPVYVYVYDYATGSGAYEAQTGRTNNLGVLDYQVFDPHHCNHSLAIAVYEPTYSFFSNWSNIGGPCNIT
jgi:hypothetical protein